MTCLSTRDSDAPPSEFSLFEALRETIYSEVATLISQNENRPHFLIELFRELQLLTSDYLRQRALYAVQDLVTQYLAEGHKDGPEEKKVREVIKVLWKVFSNVDIGTQLMPLFRCLISIVL